MSDNQLKHKTARGLLWGGIGSGGMQLLNLIFGIFLSRILTPADYGVVGALTIFSAAAGLFSESGFTLAIVNKRQATDDDYNAVFWFNIVAGVALYVLLFFLAGPIARFYHQPEMVPLARFLFLGFFLGSSATAPSAYMFRNLMVKERSQIQLTAILISGSGGLVCAFCGWGYWGIAMQTVLYSASIALFMWIRSPWRPSLSFRSGALKELLPFSTKQLLTSLFTHINNNFFSVLLGRFYTMSETGFYTQGSKWTTMGSSTIYGMVNSVGQPVFRQAVDDHVRLRRMFLKMIRFTAFVSFPAMFGLGIIAPELITLTITDKWLPCVPVIRILCVWGAFTPVVTVYTNLFNSIGRPDIYMWNTIILGLLQLLCVLLSYPFGINVMLTVYTAVNLLWIFVWQYFAGRYTGLRLRDVIVAIAPYIAIAGVSVALAGIAASHIANVWMSAIVKISVAAGMYVFSMWRLGSVVFLETVEFLKRKKLS